MCGDCQPTGGRASIGFAALVRSTKYEYNCQPGRERAPTGASHHAAARTASDNCWAALSSYIISLLSPPHLPTPFRRTDARNTYLRVPLITHYLSTYIVSVQWIAPFGFGCNWPPCKGREGGRSACARGPYNFLGGRSLEWYRSMASQRAVVARRCLLPCRGGPLAGWLRLRLRRERRRATDPGRSQG